MVLVLYLSSYIFHLVMNIALQKTIAFLFLIVLGLFLRKKIKGKEQLEGLKVLILSMALPAMIFVALLNTKVEAQLMYLPILAIAFNLILATLAYYTLPFFGIERNSSTNRTLTLLLPSLAPGFSCFPYVLEYLGKDMFAWAALADVGNKIFVLVILYMLAMHWYYQRQPNKTESNWGKRLKELGVSLIEEPVNMVILVAFALLAMGLNYSLLPAFIQDAVDRLSAMMTPLILLFIGLAVKVNAAQFRTIMGVLLWRSGVAFLLSALLIVFLPATTPVAVLLLAVCFPQSSTSFWPFAHLSAVSALEEKGDKPKDGLTFDRDLGLAVMAFSLPLSTIIVLTVCSVGGFFASPLNLTASGLLFLGSGSLIFIVKKLQEKAAAAAELANEELAVAEVRND